MKKSTIYLSSIVVMTLLFASCSSQPSGEAVTAPTNQQLGDVVLDSVVNMSTIASRTATLGPSPFVEPTYVSWKDKHCKVNEATANLLWLVLAAGVNEFVVTSDTRTTICLEGFGGAAFNKTDFILIP